MKPEPDEAFWLAIYRGILAILLLVAIAPYMLIGILANKLWERK